MSDTDRGVNAGVPNDRETWWQRHGRRVRLSVRLALILSAAAGAAWWFLLSPVAVRTHRVAAGTVTAEVMGTGTLEARTSPIVGPKIGGLITRITVDEGDRVKVGDLLIQLEDGDIKQQVGMAASEVAAAAAALDRLKADQRRAEAVAAQARLNHGRVAQLASRNVVSVEDVDKALETLSVAEAGLSVAGAAIVEGQMRLTVAQRALEYQRARLRDTAIRAPLDGLVVRRDREPGDVVSPGASVLLVVSTAEMWVTAWVDETELARLQDGQPARVVFRSEPGAEYAGTVARVGREADRETREIVVDVRVEKLPRNWVVGQRAEVYIRTGRKENVTVLPPGLLLARDGKTGVMVDERGRAVWRPVAVGLRGRETVEVVSGLAPGDVVVSPADARAGPLREGRRITRK
ncbi:MAG: efflux RND transporter periplasmic adaptor subunit [Candidatus Tectomicrobia bacterium]|nr:efflux RND transporter periplasmic adaptor subunit [Candidatus Tectomicrobia bacterium]